ncbi:MlaD family protein [Palleronia caenipelagi]|nr:MlaD family protein [Palleronia caenipelagi]
MTGMSDQDQTTGEALAAEADMQEADKRTLRDRISPVWALPILALVISIGIFWKAESDQGPRIEVIFADGAGVKPDGTKLRFRDVDVGVVEDVEFSDDLSHVIVGIRVDKKVGPYVDDGAEFWIVRPEVSAQGVSGLETVLSGVYLMGSWDGEIGEKQRKFEGLDRAPLMTNDDEGITFRIRSNDVSGLSENAPILYRGITVGKIGNLHLGSDGVSVFADAFVRTPESRLINTATRFWNTSGFDFSFGASGARLNVSSLASLVTGGITFETTVSGGQELPEDAVFRLYSDEEDARSSVFEADSDGQPALFTVVFEDSVPGLEVGADVEFSGIVVGRVSGLTGVLDEDRFGDRGVRLLTTLEIQPGKMGLDPNATPEEVLDFMKFAVQAGLRAQLQSASLLGGLQVALVQLDGADERELDTTAEPYPAIPSVAADLSDFADTAEGVFNRVNNLPIEELLDSAILVMQSANRLLNEDGVRETPNEVLALLGDVRSFVNSEGIQAIPDQASATMGALAETAQQLQQVVTQLDEAGAVQALIDALESAEEAADSVYETMEDGPETLEAIDTALASADELIKSLDGLTNDVRGMAIGDVVDSTNQLIISLDELVSEPSVRALPGNIDLALQDLRSVFTRLTEQNGTLDQANRLMAEGSDAVDEVMASLTPVLEDARQAAQSVSEAANVAPEVADRAKRVADRIEALVNDVSDLPIQQIGERTSSLLASLDDLISSPDTQRVPGALSDALSEVQRTLIQVQEGGLVENANATMASVRRGADQLPRLLNDVSVLLTQSGVVIEGYDANGAVGARLQSTLREVQEAAQSIDSLARQLERSPNSLLFGR